MEVTTLDLERLLRFAGLRVTRSRTTVLGAVHAHPHAGADMVVDAARRVLPDLSRQAVHDSLRALVETGLVRRFQVGAVVRFEVRVGDDHHHVECTSCGRIADVDCTGGHPPCLAPEDSRGFLISSAEIMYQGLCPDCAERSGVHPQRHVQQVSARLSGSVTAPGLRTRHDARLSASLPDDGAPPAQPDRAEDGTGAEPAPTVWYQYEPPTLPSVAAAVSSPADLAETVLAGAAGQAPSRPPQALEALPLPDAVAPAVTRTRPSEPRRDEIDAVSRLPSRDRSALRAEQLSPPPQPPLPTASSLPDLAELDRPGSEPTAQRPRDPLAPRTRRSAYVPAASLAVPYTLPDAPRTLRTVADRSGADATDPLSLLAVAQRPPLRATHAPPARHAEPGPQAAPPSTPTWLTPRLGPRHTSDDGTSTHDTQPDRTEDEPARPPEPGEDARSQEHTLPSRASNGPARRSEEGPEVAERADHSVERTPLTRRGARHETPRPQPV